MNHLAKQVDEIDDLEFGAAIRAHFRETERRQHQHRLLIAICVCGISLVVNFSQAWLYVQALQVCGVRP